MAGDWIPVSVDLASKTEVLRLARVSGKSRHEVAGLLVAFWGWASTQSADGRLGHITFGDLVDAIGATPKFWEQLANVGWLEMSGDELVIPNAGEWIGKGAKGRMQGALRQRRSRARDKCHAPSVTKALPEKRREEKRREYKKGSSSEDPCRPKPDQSADIRAVFDHYRTFHPQAHPKPVSTMPLWKKIRDRLKEGHSTADLKQAIDGCHADPWHQGVNDRNTKYLGLDLIVRDGSHVTKFIEVAKGELRGDKYLNPTRTDEHGRASL